MFLLSSDKCPVTKNPINYTKKLTEKSSCSTDPFDLRIILSYTIVFVIFQWMKGRIVTFPFKAIEPCFEQYLHEGSIIVKQIIRNKTCASCEKTDS